MNGSRPAGRLPLIDSLRAAAALLIFAYHALFVTGHLSNSNYGWYLNVGVPLFYGISGLLLFRPFAAAIVRGTPTPSISDYARHRVFRIIPAYWLALPLVAILLGRTAQVFSLEGIFRYFGLTQAYSLDTFVGGIGQAWTLTVEVAFYVFLPFWAWVCAKAASSAATPKARAQLLLLLISGVAILSLAWKVGTVIHFGNDIESALIPLTALPAAMDQFAVGMAVAVLVVMRGEGAESRMLAVFTRLPALGLALAAGAYWLIGEAFGVGVLRSGPFGGWGTQAIIEHEGKAIVAAGLLLAGVAAMPGRGLVGTVLGWRPLRWVGEVSYGVYLWHLALLTVLAGNAHWALGHHGLLADPGGVGITSTWPVVTFAVGFAFVATLVVGWISWRWIERPFILRSHRARASIVSDS